MSYRDTAGQLAAYRAQIADLRQKMREAQSSVELVQNALDVLFGFRGDEGAVEIGTAIGRVDEAAVQLIVAGVRAEELAHHVVANRIYEGTEPVGLFEAAVLANGDEDAREGLLLNFLDGIARKQTRTQLDQNEIAEIGDKVAFRLRIASPKALIVCVVECIELHVCLWGKPV